MLSLADLRYFCKYILHEYGNPGKLTEEEKAEVFCLSYLNGLPPTLKTLKAVAEACGIQVNALPQGTMPHDLRGYHDMYEDRRNIYYKEDDSVSGIENTILHEIREMMETLFVEADPTYEPLRTIDRHAAANHFASAVLLPKKDFMQRVYETGFDVPALAGVYSKSCSQVLLRMGEVLQGQLFFYGAIYEPDRPHPNDWRVTYWTGTTSNDSDENIYGLGRFTPHKGSPAVPGSLVGITIQSWKPHYCQHILLSRCEENGLTAITQPIINNNGVPARMVLIALLHNRRDLLETQIERVKPVIMENMEMYL